MNRSLFATTFLCAICLVADTQAGVVIQVGSTPTSTIKLTVGTMATIDFFVYADPASITLGSSNLYLEVYAGSAKASASTAPTIGAIDLSGAGNLFAGGGNVNNVNSVGNYTDNTDNDTFRYKDVDIAAVTLGTSPVKYASVTFDATHLTSSGVFQLRFDAQSGFVQTDFVEEGAGPSNVPMVNNGTSLVPVSSGLTIIVNVPEPRAFVVCSCLMVAGCIRRKLWLLRLG